MVTTKRAATKSFRRRFEDQDATLAAIVASSDDAIVSKTLDGVIKTWNAAAERMFEFTAEEAIGRPISICFPADRIGEEAEILEKVGRGERVDHLETIRRSKSGRCIRVWVTVSPVRDRFGRIIGASKIVRDISDRKAAEELSRRQQLEMEHLARLSTVGEMATGLAHELNQPLSNILTYAAVSLELIQSGGLSTQRLRTGLEEIVAETRRAGDIIGRVRRFVSKRPPRCAAVDVNGTIAEALHMMDPEFKRDELRTVMKLQRDLPAAWADSVQVMQVLVNLLRNARDAMIHPNARGRRLTVTSIAARSATTSGLEEEVRVEVSDQGCGVDSADLDRVFDPFVSTKTDGLGMGLAISRSIMHSLGGRLDCRINPGQEGMTFSLTLPVFGAGAFGAGEKE